MVYGVLLGRDVQPETSDIWRYQPFHRFRDIVEGKALFFPSLGTLADTKDPLEGVMTELNYSNPEIEIDRVWREQLAGLNPPSVYEALKRSYSSRESLETEQAMIQTHGYANCWYEGIDESEEMWHEFADLADGVLIKSVIGRLKRCFATSPGEQYIDRVEYRDLASGGEPTPIDWTRALLTKDKQWAYQRELRAFMMAPGASDVFNSIDTGVFVPILPNVLIQEVILSPKAAGALESEVRALLDNAGLAAVPIRRSALSSPA